VRGGQGHLLHRVELFAVEAQAFAAGGHDLQVRAAVEQGVAQVDHGVDHMLAVVEQDQCAAWRQLLHDAIEQGGADAFAHVDDAGKRADHALRILQRCEVDEADASGEAGKLLLRQLQRQTCLAATAHARQRQEPRVAQQRRALRELPRAADELRALLRQIARHGLGQRLGDLGAIVERGDEAIAASRDRRDHALAEQLAQGADIHLEVAFLDHEARPHDVEQFVLGDRAVAPLDERHQHVERAGAELDRLARVRNEPLFRIEFEACETVGDRSDRGDLVHASLCARNRKALELSR